MSAAAARNSSYKLQGIVTLLFRHSRPSAAAGSNPGLSPGCRRDVFFSNSYLGGYGKQGLNLRSFSGGSTKALEAVESPHFDVVKDEEDKKTQPITLPVSDKQGFSAWAKWLLGSFLTILPFLKQKWERLSVLEGEVEKVVEEAEVAAEMVENAATATEKVSAEVAEKLPDNNKMKQAVLVVEHISSVTAQEAQLAEDFIHKVGEVKQDLEEMKTIAEPVIHQIVEPHHQNNY